MSAIEITVPGHVLWQRTGEAMVLLDSVNGHYFELNETAQGAFSVLVETGDLQAAVRELTDNFEVERAQAEGDLNRLLEELASAGLIQLTRSA